MFLYTSILKIHLKLSEQNDVKIRTFHTPITYWWEFWIFKKNQENPDEIGMVAQTGKKLIIVNKRLLDSRALSIQQKYQFEIWKFHMPKATVHSGCTDLTQATAHLVIVLASRIQKRIIGENNLNYQKERGISV